MATDAANVDLSVRIGALQLANPILVASGTFGYAREMSRLVNLDRLGGIIPKTVTPQPRQGNRPWRTVETAAGLLNSIGLDNDGVDAFIDHHLPFLRTLRTAIIVSVAGRDVEEYAQMASQLTAAGGVDAFELNISCPNVSGGTDFGVRADHCRELVAAVRQATDLPLLAKLTPNVADVAAIAVAAEEGGADAVCLINTVRAMAIDWRRRKPMLGNIIGGLSGPAIKPIALRCVYETAQQVRIPIVGVGGVATIDDAMEFFVAGATAVQVGTANYYDPTASEKMVDALPAALAEAGVASVGELVGSLSTTT